MRTCDAAELYQDGKPASPRCGLPAETLYDISGYASGPVIARCGEHALDFESWRSRLLTQEQADVLEVMAS